MQITTNWEVKTFELQGFPRCAKYVNLHNYLDEELTLQ